MKTSNVFRRAKRQLLNEISAPSSTEAGFICSCIRRVRAPWPDKHRALRVIRERMGGCMALGDWLRYEHDVPDEDITATLVQAHRTAWLDLLIAEFEAKGD